MWNGNISAMKRNNNANVNTSTIKSFRSMRVFPLFLLIMKSELMRPK